MKKSKKVGGIRCKIVLILLFCTITMAACGKEKEGGLYDFGGVEPKEIDPWVYLQDTALSSNPQILGFASSAGGLPLPLVWRLLSFLFCSWLYGFYFPEVQR